MEQQRRVPVIVLTGGPCAGKTSAMSHVTKRLSELGYGAVVVPELATTLMSGGIPLLEVEQADELTVKSKMVKAQMHNEGLFADLIGLLKTPHVVLCDRGVLDSRAYMSDETWEKMLEVNGWTVNDLRERRYDAVIHLVTAAIGAESFYTLENNETRTETVEEAIELDHKCANAYLGHPKHFFADNINADFTTKLSRVLNFVLEVMQLPQVLDGNERRLLLDSFPPEELWEGVKYEEFRLEIQFLNHDQTMGLGRLTKRSQGDSTTHYCSFQHTDNLNRSWSVNERRISDREYHALSTNTDPSRVPVKKRLRSFLYKETLLVVNEYLSPRYFNILEIRVPGRTVDVHP
eukprot:TRINITY_DN10557_c0_g1_i2.p1 TRINITY_DN10557_c0_g1~~TRINITY_DN10557_c0_g1_i2.p1  ORF type:complete len:348 (-),score=67.92 TRINITY_DN10557_c0_g1_i2:137-1180(-)